MIIIAALQDKVAHPFYACRRTADGHAVYPIGFTVFDDVFLCNTERNEMHVVQRTLFTVIVL